jgi:hypothetical protein
MKKRNDAKIRDVVTGLSLQVRYVFWVRSVDGSGEGGWYGFIGGGSPDGAVADTRRIWRIEKMTRWRINSI